MRNIVRYRDKRHPLVRAFNWAGKFSLEKKLPWINLDEDMLLVAARRRTGYDDFGENSFMEPFRILLEAVENEGQLTYAGRIAARTFAIGGLVARLRMQREVVDHPEILDQPVQRPLIIVGLPRTGTSLLHELFALDPGGRPLVAWETISPAPIGVGRRRRFDFRIMMTASLVWMSKTLLVPETAGMHKYTYKGVAECTSLIWPSFVWPMAAVLPSVREWFRQVDDSTYDAAYEVYRLSLQMLHWQRPATSHWVLKSPQHVWAMDALARVVPEAALIQTHRNLNEVMPSFCSLAAAMMSMFTDTIETKRMGPVAMDFAHEILDRMFRARERIESKRISDVRYPDLIADPIGTVRRIYEEQNYDFTAGYETRMQKWLELDRRTGRPKHVYSHSRFSLNPEAIAAAFTDYHTEFGI